MEEYSLAAVARAPGIATRLDGNRPKRSRQSQHGDWLLVEKEAATGGEATGLAKQGLRAHNLGSGESLR